MRTSHCYQLYSEQEDVADLIEVTYRFRILVKVPSFPRTSLQHWERVYQRRIAPLPLEPNRDLFARSVELRPWSANFMTSRHQLNFVLRAGGDTILRTVGIKSIYSSLTETREDSLFLNNGKIDAKEYANRLSNGIVLAGVCISATCDIYLTNHKQKGPSDFPCSRFLYAVWSIALKTEQYFILGNAWPLACTLPSNLLHPSHICCICARMDWAGHLICTGIASIF